MSAFKLLKWHRQLTQLVLPPTQRAGSWDVTWGGGGGGGARVAGSVGRLANGFGSKGEIAGTAAVKRLRLQVLWWVAVLWWGNGCTSMWRGRCCWVASTAQKEVAGAVVGCGA